MDDQDLIICAFRYCLGRRTYIVKDMCCYLRDNWGLLTANSKNLIIGETVDAVKRGLCGMQMDCQEWINLLHDIGWDEEDLHCDGCDG